MAITRPAKITAFMVCHCQLVWLWRDVQTSFDDYRRPPARLQIGAAQVLTHNAEQEAIEADADQLQDCKGGEAFRP